MIGSGKIFCYLGRLVAPIKTKPKVTCDIPSMGSYESRKGRGSSSMNSRTAGLNNPPLTLKKIQALTAKLNPKLKAI